MSAWRPIDTEPLDGTMVLYYSRSGRMWSGNRPKGHCRGNWCKKKGKWYGAMNGDNSKDTHWMPLPEPPND